MLAPMQRFKVSIFHDMNAYYGAEKEKEMLNYFRCRMPIKRQQNIKENCNKKEKACD